MLLLNLEQSFHYNGPQSAHQRPKVPNNKHQHLQCHVLCQWCGYPAPPCTVTISSMVCWICRQYQLCSMIANDVWSVPISIRERERYLIWTALVQRLRFASFWLLAESEIKAKRWATNVCFCHWRFVCVFDQQPPLSRCLTPLLISSNGLPFMRQETRGWREGCDWGEWNRWEDTLQTNHTDPWKLNSAHIGSISACRLGIIHVNPN